MIISLVSNAIYIYGLIIFVYIIMSWFPGARESQFGMFLATIVEPYLEIFRRIIPPIGMIDISPIVAFFVLRLAGFGLIEILRMFL